MTCPNCAALAERVRKLERAALSITKAKRDLELPAGTLIVAPSGVRAVIGRDGYIDPSSVNVVGQPTETASKWRPVNLNDPTQRLTPGALPNSSAPLGAGQPSSSIVANLGGREGRLDDLAENAFLSPGPAEE
jgi:hypothetical protein